MTGNRKMLNSRQTPQILTLLDDISNEYTTDGIKNIYKQDHLALAITHYAKCLHSKGIKDGTNIRKALDI
jgi:hypothetical protein